MKFKHLTYLLSSAVILLALFYLLNNYASVTDYIWRLRISKLTAYVVVVLAIVPATFAFQTLFRSHYLSPNVLGMDAIFSLCQTLMFFIGSRFLNREVGPLTIQSFLINLTLMLVFSAGLYMTVRPRQLSERFDESLLIMLGLILSQLIRSLTTFMQVIMDPSDYDALFSRLNPSFQRVSTSLLFVGIIIIVVGLVILFNYSSVLDVMKVDHDTAASLGIDIRKVTYQLIFIIVLMIGTATAIVGPLTFLGFMIANITYQFTQISHHWQYYIIGSLLGLIMVIGGQWVNESLLHNHYNLSVIVDVAGALMFFTLLFKGGRAYQTQ